MQVQLVSIAEMGETTATQRDYNLKEPVEFYDKDNLIIGRARYVYWAAVSDALLGGPMYAMIASSKWSGIVTQDYDLSGVLTNGLGLVGSQLAATAALSIALGYGWVQTFGDNVNVLDVNAVVSAGAPMIGASANGYWDDISGSFLTSDTTTAYNMGYSGVGGYWYIAAASSLITMTAGCAHLRTLYA